MITARDLAISQAAPVMRPPPVEAMRFVLPPIDAATAAPFRERLLLFVIYITLLVSSVAFIEPSPHDALMGVLAVACVVAGVRFDRQIMVLFLLLLVWNTGGLLSLLNVPDQQKTIQYAGTSIYLAVAAVLWACLIAENTMTRLATMRAAYILSAVVIALAGISGYLHAFPAAHELFAPNDRALGGFKDPNVFGPFLIWPIMVILERMMARRISLRDVAMIGILMVGLLLAFSRGAWFHFALSCVVMIGLAFLTAPTPNKRLRIFVLSALALSVLVAFVAILLTFPAIDVMFKERASLFQSYDVGEGGRFRLQQLAVAALLDFPNGMGPFEFARTHANQQHNVYLQAFLVYGWTGAMAYLLLLFSTVLVGLRTAFVRTPWQPYIITALATFVGEIAEGLVIDTDHWRHFYLLLGMIWGLTAATYRYVRTPCVVSHAI